MNYKIALISTKEHCNYIEAILKEHAFQCHVDFIYYNAFLDLPNIYDEIESEYDAFCTTGSFAREAIIKARNNQLKPVFTISGSSTEIYRELLTLINANRDLDLSRVMFDYSFCVPNMYFKTANRYLVKEINHEKMLTAILQNTTLQELLDTDQKILDNAMIAWKQKKFDLVLCRFSTAYTKLKAAGIPCQFIYPAVDNILDTFNKIIDSLDRDQLNNSLPGIIYLSSPDLISQSSDEITAESVNLQKCLLDFNYENTTGFLIKKNLSGFEIYTTQQVLCRITDNFTICQLRSYITGRLGMKIHIGYGIGVNILLARAHAIEACNMSEKKGQSYAVTRSGDFIGPLVRETLDGETSSETIPSKILLAAKDTGLSISTLQRISSALELIGSKEITTQELANTLQVTVANTNRFLNALQLNGFANIIGEKKSLMKGRPSRIYRIEL